MVEHCCSYQWHIFKHTTQSTFLLANVPVFVIRFPDTVFKDRITKHTCQIKGKNWYHCYSVGAICCCGLGTLVPLEGMITKKNQYKMITFILWGNVAFLIGVISSETTVSTSTWHEGSLNGLRGMKIMLSICYGLHSHQIPNQLNTYGRFWHPLTSSF